MVAEVAGGESGAVLAIFILFRLGWPALVGNKGSHSFLIHQLFYTKMTVLSTKVVLIEGGALLARISCFCHCGPSFGRDENAFLVDC
jgi:hypothetical protein